MSRTVNDINIDLELVTAQVELSHNTVSPQTLNFERVSDSIEKVTRILDKVKATNNEDAIHTWNLVLAGLKLDWRDATLPNKR